MRIWLLLMFFFVVCDTIGDFTQRDMPDPSCDCYRCTILREKETSCCFGCLGRKEKKEKIEKEKKKEKKEKKESSEEFPPFHNGRDDCQCRECVTMMQQEKNTFKEKLRKHCLSCLYTCTNTGTRGVWEEEKLYNFE